MKPNRSTSPSMVPGLSILGLTAILSACGGSSTSIEPAPPPPEPEPVPTEPPTLNKPQGFSGPLSQAGESDFSRFLKNGIYRATLDGSNGRLENDAGAPAPLAPTAVESFSTTNTQESGVDEADRVEYDGDFLYLATYAQWMAEGVTEAGIRVLQRNEDFSLTEVNFLAVPGQDHNIQGMYLHQDRLSVVGADFPVYPLVDMAIEPWIMPEGRVNISIFDTAVPSEATSVVDMQIDGWLLSSRRIEDDLYVVTTYVPGVDGLDPGEGTDEVLLDNYLTILDTPTEALMPRLHIGEQSEALNQPEDCYIPEAATEADGHAQLLTVTRINTQQTSDIESMCMSIYAFTLYMSQQNIYIASTLETETAFHKVALSDLSYQATGTVPGSLGWRSSPNLRLDEEGEVFRVVSSDYSQEDPTHTFSVMRQQGDQLNVIAQLPNDDAPEPIGKPNEDIFAVRFLGDRGYIVTFERIDPLYVLDLSVDETPVIAGSLEIPGFSSYLHPMENGYLLGVGQQVEVEDIPQTGTRPVLPPVTTGMKVSLFNVADPQNPLEVDSIVRESAYTPVEFDYKALSVLNSGGKYQFAMPLEEWGLSGNEPALTLWNPDNSLMLIETDTNSESAELTLVDQVRAENEEGFYVWAGDDRSVIHGENVYYIHGNQVWHAKWEPETLVTGPY